MDNLLVQKMSVVDIWWLALQKVMKLKNLTTSPVAQIMLNIDMSMQVQVCKDKAATSVKSLHVLSLNPGSENNRFRCPSHRDELNRSTLDLNS